MWPETGTTKLDYITYLFQVSDYILPYVKNRCLTVIRFPDGVEGESFYQKNIPAHAPSWIQTTHWKNTEYVLCNNKETLVWLANLASLEFHIAFNRIEKENYPTELVFDLDPSVPGFPRVREAALVLRDALGSLSLKSYAKTSGATGMQVYVPLLWKYTYQETRKVSHFLSSFLVEKRPDLFTVERLKKNRGEKLYIDYVQQAPGKTLPAPYTLRARILPSVSTPVDWGEVEKGFIPEDFTMDKIPQRLVEKGDLFTPLQDGEKESLDEVLEFIDRQWLN
jgi:bifunctional non-homologous end joining protein LigD